MKSNDCSGVRRWRRMLAVLSVLAACGGSAHAQTSDADGSLLPATPQDIGDRYPAGSIRSGAQADQALRDMREERKQIGAAFERSSRACLGNFFMTGCLLDAKEQRRTALQRVKAVEVEANTFKRQLRADARDEAIDARKKMQEADLAMPSATANKAADAEAVNVSQASMPDDDADARRRQRKAAKYQAKVDKAHARQNKVAVKKAAAKE